MTRSTLARTLAALAVVFVILPATAFASWNATGTNGKGYSKALSVNAGNTPTVSVSGRNVTVNWTATGGSVPVTGYIVKRYNTSGVEQTIGAGCSGTVATTSCTENGVPSGSWKYSVTPARQNWRGAESTQSATATVGAASLSLTPNTVSSLPANLSGSISNYVQGQTVTFRLDNQTTGTVLTGSITPSPVPANGTATVSVTLPAGTANGSHTIYAIGSGSDVASANVTVAVPTTITTSAYDWRDQSSGTEANASEAIAFANDSRTTTTGAWATAFAANRYLDVDLNSPLRSDVDVTGGNINMRFATGNVLSTQGCFYVEARRASDNTLLTTYGSAASPYCTTSGNTQTSFSIPIGGSTTGAIANDTRFRIYGRTNTVGTHWAVDQVSLSLTTDDGNFTLFPDSFGDAADTSIATTPWQLAKDDDQTLLNAAAANWPTAYSTSRFMKATFPAYVPSGATISSVTLTHVYRSNTVNRPVCNYVEVFAGATSIGVHNTAGVDLSCSPSNTADVTDTISLPEVDTVAEANSLSARIYMRRTGNTTQSRHDQVRLSITYVK